MVPPRLRAQPLHMLREALQVPFGGDHPRRKGDPLLVVHGATLEPPQVGGVRLVQVVEPRAEGLGVDPLHVPGVEVLVRRESEELLVPPRFREAEARTEQDRPVLVLEAAVTGAGVEGHELVVRIGERAAHEHLGSGHDAGEVGGHPGHVPVVARLDPVFVGHAVHLEMAGLERADGHWRVHERVEVGGGEGRGFGARHRANGPGRAAGGVPRRHIHGEVGGGLPGNEDEQVAGQEEREIAVHERGTD